MKKLPLILCLISIYSSLLKSQNTAKSFTWIKGNKLINAPGSYGIKGVATNANNPGARSGCICWTDLSGNHWLFGGFGRDGSNQAGIMNDLWKYNPTTNQWSWVRGSNINNQNGYYGSISVTTASNEPCARVNGSGWTDKNGNLWLFGGEGPGSTGTISGLLDDLWMYNMAANQWVWMGGSFTAHSNYASSPGVYGTMGVPSNTNQPGARSNLITWTDGNGDLYLLGGSTKVGLAKKYFSDMWKYSTTTNEWTWMKGQQQLNQSGFFGVQGVPSSTNCPGSRSNAAHWEQAGTLWLFGGSGIDSTGTQGCLNDLWQYDVASDMWTWMGGSKLTGQPKTGSIGVTSANNIPGGGANMVSWVGSGNNLYFFGGQNCSGSFSNELWKYNSQTGKWTWLSGINSQQGTYGTIGITNSNNYPGSRMDACGWSDGMDNFWLFGGSGFDASGFYGEQNDLWYIRECFKQSVVINSTATEICSGQSTKLFASGATSFKWSNGQSGYSITIAPVLSTIFTVTSNDALSCGNQATISIQVNDCTDLKDTETNKNSAFIFPNPNNGRFHLKLPKLEALVLLNVYSANGTLIFKKKISVNEEEQSLDLCPGLYYLELEYSNSQPERCKLIINSN